MKRLLLTLEGKRCPFRCRYCFTHFSQYDGTRSLEDVERHPDLIADADIVYPACDTDLFATLNPISVLWRAVKLGLHISVSTKASISEGKLPALAELNRWMNQQRKVLKIAVSLSTRNSIPSIEPGTASYVQRVRNF